MEEKKSEGKKQPVKRFSCGGVSASVWENDLPGGGKVASVSVQRVYKDKATKEFKYTGSLKANDLPKAIQALGDAYRFLNEKKEEAK